jgi:predicted house-cleaning noncanonical NTP pyrophosphatase (MazG superfamily)
VIPLLNRLQQEEIMRQVKRVVALQKRNRTSVLSSRMTEESEKASNKKALEELADLLKEM